MLVSGLDGSVRLDIVGQAQNSHADSHGDALTKGTGAHIDAWMTSLGAARSFDHAHADITGRDSQAVLLNIRHASHLVVIHRRRLCMLIFQETLLLSSSFTAGRSRRWGHACAGNACPSRAWARAPQSA